MEVEQNLAIKIDQNVGIKDDKEIGMEVEQNVDLMCAICKILPSNTSIPLSNVVNRLIENPDFDNSAYSNGDVKHALLQLEESSVVKEMNGNYRLLKSE